MISKILKDKATAPAELTKLGYVDGVRAFTELAALSKGPLGGLIDELSGFALNTPAPEKALAGLNEVSSTADTKTLETLASLKSKEKSKEKDKDKVKNLVTLLGSSPYLSNILLQNIELLKEFFIEDGLVNTKTYDDDPLTSLMEDSNKDEAMAILRRFRNREYLRIGARDLLCYADMTTITGELSALARVSLDAAYGFALNGLKAKYGEPFYRDEEGLEREALFSIIALGKLGGGELNFLSDIDILYICSTSDGETSGIEGAARSKIDLHSFFGRLAKEITTLIGTVTKDGFVFRVDLDLRPDGGSGQMVNSIASLETYYHSWGRPWERSAMIKASHAGGAVEVSREFLELIEPFVYRRNLDFAAIEEIKAMKENIDLTRKKSNSGEVNVKLGTGGIREIEFFTQALQLIYGGRDGALRISGTLNAISLLKDAGKLLEDDASVLRESYILLRNLEHRIQMVDGRQTQTLPSAPEELAHVARTLKALDIKGTTADAATCEIFWKRYNEVTSNVESVYRSLFYDTKEELAEEVPLKVRELLLLQEEISTKEGVTAATEELGCGDEVAELIVAFGKEPTNVRLTPKTTAILERLRPFMVTKALKTTDPRRAMRGAVRFVSTIGARTGLYALLAENPPFVEEIVKIFAESEFLTDLLVDRPENLDMLLTRDSSQIKRDGQELDEELSGLLGGSAHFEESLDILRRFKSGELFRIGTGDIMGSIEAKEVPFELTTLAEVLLKAALRVSLKEVGLKRERPGGGAFYILGLGGLGAFELLYGSDLDIIFVYTLSSASSASNASDDITAHEFYVTLAQKIINTLSAKTGAGTIYSIDTRLRPSGSAGPLVVSKESLINYHKKEGATWERQAMIKARLVASTANTDDPNEGEEIIKALQGVIYSKGFTTTDAEEMLALRARMEEEIAKEGAGDINIKVGRGGLTDIEFITQALQLRFGGVDPSIRETETLKALKGLLRVEAIEEDEFKTLKEAYLFYRLLEVKLRIVENISEGTIKAGSEEVAVLLRKIGDESPEEAKGRDKGSAQEARFIETCEKYRAQVRDIYIKTFKEKIK